MPIQPYLFFNGRCEEALDFYQQALGARLEMLMRFSESPEPPPPGMVAPGQEHKVMHASMRIGDSMVMASDGCPGEPSHFEGFALSLSAADAGQARTLFDALLVGGEVRMPLGPTFWSPCFGMVSDRFGVCWMIDATPPGENAGATS